MTPLFPDDRDFFSGKRVLVTGGGGSVGTELVSHLLQHRVERIRVLDNNETAIFQLIERFGDEKRIEAFYCDIRDEHEIVIVLREEFYELQTDAAGGPGDEGSSTRHL